MTKINFYFRFEPNSSAYIHEHVNLNADLNMSFVIRMLKKSVFQLDDHALVMKYYDLIDRDVRDSIPAEVLKFRFNQALPKIIIRAVFSQYYCSSCVTLLLDKKELKRHMMQMHRPDVLTQHRRANAEMNEEETLLRVVRRSKLRRWLFGTLKNEELVRKIREANQWTMTLVNNDTNERSDIAVHEQEPIPEPVF